MMHTLHSALLGGLLLAAVPLRLHAQPLQDGLVAYPNVYKVQLENAYVRLIRVRLPGFAQLGEHTHPAGIMLHVYFNDADPVQFNHDGPPNDVTRPAVVARSYRIGRTRPETHAVVNTGPGLSDYMRVELKTEGDEGFLRRIPTPPLVDSTSARVEVDNAQYRASRVTIASGQSLELRATASQPFLLLALTDSITVEQDGSPTRALQTGDDKFVDVSPNGTPNGTSRVRLRNAGAAPVQLLRVDFLTAPSK